MANSATLKAIASLLFLLLALTCASAARSLIDDEDTAVPTVAPPLSGGFVQTPTTAPATTVAGGSGATASSVVAGAGAATTGSSSVVAGAGAATTGSSSVITGAGAASTGSSSVVDPHALTFFMHDILGGSNPTARAVTGIVTNPALSAQVPFAKPNGANLPLNTGVPQNSNNNGLINNNNIPILPGLGGNTGNLVGQNNNGNGNSFIGGNSGFPVLNGGQLPQGMTLQKLMFGTLTVFDDELTEGHELGSGLLGKAQGFYVASSEDGNSQTIALTAMFESGDYVDSISLFGVHRTVVSESQLAIMGGTGKYVNARGFATVKALPVSGQSNTDGVETVLQFSVYLA